MISYKVLSPSFDSSVPHSPQTKINIEDYKSGREYIAPTVGSYGHFEGMSPINYHGKKAHSTSRNTWTTSVSDFEKNGNFSPQVDDGIKRGIYQFSTFDNWKATGENPQAREYIFIPKDTHSLGVVESFNERKLEFPVKTDTPVNLYVHDWFSNLPSNKVGEGFHRAREIKQEVINRASSRHGQEFYEHIKQQGRSLEPVEYVAYGFRPKGIIASIGRADDGKIILFYGEDGPKYKVDKELLLDEEFMHNARKDYDNIHSLEDAINKEIAAKTDVRDFNLRMAKKYENVPQQRTKYLNRAKQMQDDIDTTSKRYSKLYRREHNLESIADSDKSKSSKAERTEREESAKPDTAQKESQHESNSESAESSPEGNATAEAA